MRWVYVFLLKKEGVKEEKEVKRETLREGGR